MEGAQLGQCIPNVKLSSRDYVTDKTWQTPFADEELNPHSSIYEAQLTNHTLPLRSQNFNGPRCDLYENILAHGCSSAALLTAQSAMKVETVRLRHSLFPLEAPCCLTS